jgi:hypothetical protein
MSGDPEPRAPAGWYADPRGSRALRYWDGSRWVEGRAFARSRKSPSMAVLLTLLWIGAGHLYADGARMKPARLMLVNPAIMILGLIVFPYGFALWPPAFAWAAFDARREVLNIR